LVDRVVDRRVAVGVGERRGQRPGRQPLDLAEDVARGLDVQLGERARAQGSVAPKTSKRLNSMSRRLLL
jgi:hypothetical protein